MHPGTVGCFPKLLLGAEHQQRLSPFVCDSPDGHTEQDSLHKFEEPMLYLQKDFHRNPALLSKRGYDLPLPLLGEKFRMKPIWLLPNQTPAFPFRTKQVAYLPEFSFSKVMKIFIKIKKNPKKPPTKKPQPPSHKIPKTQN